MDHELTEAVIKVQFISGTSWTSRAIEWFSAGGFSHVDAVLPDGDLLGARSDNIGGGKGVLIRPASYEEWAQRKIFTLVATHGQEAMFRRFLNEQLNKPYDHTAIWGFATGRDWREADSWFCSELIAAALEYSGALPVLYSPVNKVTPATLATVLSAVGAIAS
jgi:hypothetical protein